MEKDFSRRNFLRAGALTILGTAGAVALTQTANQTNAASPPGSETTSLTAELGENKHQAWYAGDNRRVDHQRNGFNKRHLDRF
jgi:hypothetical protein